MLDRNSGRQLPFMKAVTEAEGSALWIILLKNPNSRRNPTFWGIPFKCLLKTPSDVNQTPRSAIII
jgi:hypothetical protein